MTDGMIHSDGPFDSASREILQSIANMMIPASDEFGVPSAGDSRILAATLDYLAGEREVVNDGLSALNEAARARHGRDFAELADSDKPVLIEGLLTTHGLFLQAVMPAILACYYQDPRVMASLDMEIRPPFPGGFDIEAGDWSLLEPVRKREPFYRKV